MTARPFVFAALSAALLADPAAAQVQSSWDFGYAPAGSGPLHPQEIVASPDGGVVALARDTQGSGAVDRSVVVKFSENGDRLWAYSFASPSVVTNNPSICMPIGRSDIDVDADGNVYLVLSTTPSSELRKFAPDGTLLWTRTAETGGPFTDRLTIDSAGNVVLVGANAVGVGIPSMLIRRIAPDGTLLAANDSVTSGYPVDVLTGPQDEVIVELFTDIPCWSPSSAYAAWDAGFSPLFYRSAGYLQPREKIAVSPVGEVLRLGNGFANGSNYFFVLRVDLATGQQLPTWYSSTALGSVAAADLAVDATGAAYVAVRHSVDGIGVLRFDDQAVHEDWATFESTTGGGPSGSSHDIAIAPSGSIVATGRKAGAQRVYSLRPDGTEEWTIGVGGTNSWFRDANGDTLAFDPRGNPLYTARTSTAAPMQVGKLVEGDAGSVYCSPAVANSTGVPARLTGLGSDLVTDDNLTLFVDKLPEGTFTLLLASMAPGNLPGVGGGQGTLCLAGSIGRYVAPGQIRRANNSGQASLQLDLGSIPQPTGLVAGTAGQTWNFQAWYRDVNPALTSNLTDALAVVLR